MTVVLRAQGLTVGYVGGGRRRQILRRVNLELRPGELVCLLGPNGCGKSTLLRTLAGLQKPLAGKIEIDGAALASLSARQLARRVAVQLAEPLMVGAMTVAELVALGRYPHTGWSGRLSPIDRQVVAQAISEVGIEHLADRPLEASSDGERQKAMIARALAQEPKVLLLDEPTAFLDLPGRFEVGNLLRRAADEGQGRAVVLSTHDLDFALGTADRLWWIDRQGNFEVGAPSEVVAAKTLERVFGVPDLALFARHRPTSTSLSEADQKPRQ